jgi:cytochrome c5
MPNHLTRGITSFVAASLMLLVTSLTSAQDFSGFSGEQLYQRFCTSCHGTDARRMPVWGYEFASATVSEPDAGEKEAVTLIDKLVEYLRSIQNPPAPDRP